MMRRLLALLALATMVLAPPLFLGALGFTDVASIHLWSLTDVRVLLLLLTVLGWLAYGVWMLSLAVELANALSGHRVRVTLPGLGGPRAVAAILLGILLAGQAGQSAQATSPTPSTAPAVPASSQGVPASATTEPADTAAPVADPVEGTVHVVEEGDDLWSLAEHHLGAGSAWRQLVEANPDLLADPLADLVPGQRLLIPTAPQGSPPPQRTPTVTVQRGDTLRSLAEHHLGDEKHWPAIRDANADRIADPDHIETGWVLVVPQNPPGRDAGDRVEPEASAPGATTAPSSASHAPTPSAEPTAPPSNPVSAPTQPAHATLAPDTSVASTIGVAGGLTSLSAAVVLGGVALRRRARDQARPVGRRYVPPGEEARAHEAQLARLASAEPPLPASRVEEGAPAGDSGRPDLLARAMRILAHHWWSAGEPPLALEVAVLDDQAVEFRFHQTPPSAPDGFVAIGRSLTAPWVTLRDLTSPDHVTAYPALVTLGEDDAGRLLMVDLMASGVLAIRQDGFGAERELLAALVVELASSPWGADADLTVVTQDAEFADAAGQGRIARECSVLAALTRVSRVVEQRARAVSGAWDAARLDPNLADAWAPQVFLFEDPVDTEQIRRLDELLTDHSCGVAVVLAAPLEVGPADWVLDAEGDTAVVQASAHTAQPQRLPDDARAALTDLWRHADEAPDEPAPWWSDETPSEEPMNIIALRPRVEAPADGPRLALLGPIELTGCAGSPPVRAVRQCIEYAAWIHLHPGTTPVAMGAALQVAEGTRRSNLSRLRTWLGTKRDGTLLLPDAYAGRIELDPSVTSDWQELELLVSGGINRQPLDRLVAALELVRGAPLADAAPSQWGWAEEFRSDASALIRDLGVTASRLARGRQDLETARWAANRALLAAPEDELLLCERIRTELMAGRRDDVARLVERIVRNARVLGVDLLPETVLLCQQAVEGRSRARA